MHYSYFQAWIRKSLTYLLITSLIMSNLSQAMENARFPKESLSGQQHTDIKEEKEESTNLTESWGSGLSNDLLPTKKKDKYPHLAPLIDPRMQELPLNVIALIYSFLDKKNLIKMRLVNTHFKSQTHRILHFQTLNADFKGEIEELDKGWALHKYTILTDSADLIQRVYHKKGSNYQSSSGEIELKSISQREGSIASLEDLIPQVAKVLKITNDIVLSPPLSLPHFYKVTVEEADVKLNDLYELACKGDINAYQELDRQAPNNAIAAGLLLRYLLTVGKNILTTGLTPLGARLNYTYKWLSELESLAGNGHSYAQDILAVLYGPGGLLSADTKKSIHYAQKAAKQGLIRAQEYLTSLNSEPFSPKTDFHLLLAFKNGSLSAAHKLASRIVKSDRELSLKVLKYAASCGDRDSLAAIGRLYLEKNDLTRASKYFRALIKEHHILGYYYLGLKWYGKRSKKKKDDDKRFYLIEEALYKVIRHIQTTNNSDLIKASPEGKLIRKAYNKLLKLWAIRIDSAKIQEHPSTFITLKTKHLAIKCYKTLDIFDWPKNEKKLINSIKSFWLIADHIISHKAFKSEINQQLYAAVISKIYIQVCNTLQQSSNSSVWLSELYLDKLKKLLSNNIESLQNLRHRTDDQKNLLLLKDLRKYRSILLLYGRGIISENFLTLHEIDYGETFPFFYNSIESNKNTIFKLNNLKKARKDVVLKFWDIFLLPPQFANYPHHLADNQKIEKVLKENENFYIFFKELLEKRKKLKLPDNMPRSEFAGRLKNIMLYISNELTRELTENKVETADMQIKHAQFSNLIINILKLLKEDEVKSIAKKLDKYAPREIQFGDILLCAYYAAKSYNKAYEQGVKAVKEGTFDNLLIILNAKWITPFFRNRFLNEFDEELRGMLSKTDSSVIRVPTPESISFMSNAYYFGNTVFFVDHVKAVYWFLLALDYKSERALNSLVNILVSDRELTLLLANNGVKQFFELLIAKNLRSRYVAELHLARILIEEDKEQICPAAYILINNSLNNERIGHKNRKRYFWSNILDRREQYVFSEKEKELLQVVENENNNLYVRGRAAYNLACLHLWGGYKQQETVEKTLEYFSLAFKMGIFQSAFFLTLIQAHLQNFSIPKQINNKELWYTNSLKLTTRPFLRQKSIMSKRDKHHNLAFSKFEEKNVTLRAYFQRSNAARDLNLGVFYEHGIGSEPFLGKSIKLLRREASHNFLANLFLENKYPAFQIMHKHKLNELLKHRFYTNGRPKISIIGGGLTGIITALQIANLKDTNGEPLFDIHIFEKQAHLLDGASKLVSRLHLGGEYPKDGMTAQQCLLSAILFRQMFQTELFLTLRKAIDFLIAQESLVTPRSSHHLDFKTLLQQYEELKDTYQRYYDELKAVWGEETANRLFGKPEDFVHILEKKNLKDLKIGLHFTKGLHTPERGFQPVGLGIMLEHLLKQKENITLHLSSGIHHIHPIKKGYRMEVISPTDLSSTFYTRYIINASWVGVPHINAQVKKSRSKTPQKEVRTTVYLRSIVLADISECSIPSDRSFFGLIGEHGGMLSFFNDKVASIFVPLDKLSYQGKYELDEDSPLTNSLPKEAWERYYKLSNTAKGDRVAQRILNNAKEKYKFLKNAKVISLITQTTLSRDEELHQRQYDNVRWVDPYKRCLEAYSPKGSFAIFTAFQVLIKLFELPEISRIAQPLDEETRLFLSQFKDNIKPGGGDQSSINTVKLPASLCLVKNDEDLPPREEWISLAHLYAFRRKLPLTLFNSNSPKITAQLTMAEKFKVIPWVNVIDLKDNILSLSLAEALLKILKHANIRHLKLGRVEVCKHKTENSYKGREINGVFVYNKEEKDLSIKILNQAASLELLESLYLYKWDMSSKRFGEPLAKLWTGLQCFSLVGGFVSPKYAEDIIVEGSKLRALTLANLTDSSLALSLITERLYILSDLEELKLAGVHIGIKYLVRMIQRQHSLKRLFLRGGHSYLPHPANPKQSHIDEQLMKYESLISAISNAKNLESVELRGNSGLELIQANLDYYFLRKGKYLPICGTLIHDKKEIKGKEIKGKEIKGKEVKGKEVKDNEGEVSYLVSKN